MATIVVEDGTGVAGANSYVTEAEVNTYVSDRGLTAVTSPAVRIIQAMDYLEQMDFQGYKLTKEQPLQFPRSNIVIDGYEIEQESIPVLLKEAQIELVIGIENGNNPLADVGRETVREKVGDLEVEYSASARAQTYLKAAHTKLQKLLKNSGSLKTVRV